MTLSRDAFACRLSFLLEKCLSLPLHPRQFFNDGQADSFIVDTKWCGDTDMSIRGIDTQVQVLDILPNDLNVEAGN